MKFGQSVVWTSKGAKNETIKQGKIVAVVDPGKEPYDLFINKVGTRMNKPFYKIQFRGGPRKKESYIVAVEGKYGFYLYWPKVSKLTFLKG